MIKNFKKGFVGDYRVKVTPRKLRKLCELDWPAFDVRWPPEGTLDLPTDMPLQPSHMEDRLVGCLQKPKVGSRKQGKQRLSG